MKQGIHPNYVECTVRCTCGNTWVTRSTKSEMTIDLCDKCHPFYTGQQKLVDTGGRVQRFSDKFGGAAQAQLAKAKAAKEAKAKKAAEEEAARKAAKEGDDGAVMVGVGAVVQQGDTGGGADLIQDCLHNFHISAFRDIGNTFNNVSHSN